MTCAPVVVRTTEKLSKNQYLSKRILYQISLGWALKFSNGHRKLLEEGAR